MHPNTFFAKHFNHTKRDEAFVVMSFAAEFQARWEQVIEPCLRDDVGLTPNRVDYNQSGESIIHDILDGIAHARVVVADITCSPMKDMRGTMWPQRNGNVMWEVGIAHTMRLPDEVILIQSDNEPSIFDLTQFRAFPYHPAEVAESRKWLATLVNDRLRSVDQSASVYVSQCAQSISFTEWHLLTVAMQQGHIAHPVLKNMRDVMSNMSILPALSRLLEMGALTTEYLQVTPQLLADKQALNTMPLESLVRYHATPLAHAIMAQAAVRMGFNASNIQQAMEQLADTDSQSQVASM